MEITRWNKDKTPYLIFFCSKCKRWLYVKTSQKTKKCLNCGKTYRVDDIIDNGEITTGLSEAIAIVKYKQNELAIKETGTAPDLKNESRFAILSHSFSKNKMQNPNQINLDYEKAFKQLLIRLSKMYQRFPKYLILLLAKEYEIPKHEISLFIRRFTNEGLLIPLKNNYFVLKKLV